MTFAFRALAVFGVTLAAAWCWVLYLRYCAERRAVKAALADCGIVALSMVNVVGYTEDRRLALPILLAAFVGTFLVVRKKP
jgi:hypothetical protein